MRSGKLPGRDLMPLRKLKLPFAFLILVGFVLSARADDANIQLTTNNGTTQFGFQDSTPKDIVTVNSAGVVNISSNTILPGTTFYQSGNASIGSVGDIVSMPIVNISSNAVMPGATFYQNAGISLGTAAQSISISSNVVIGGGNATIYQSGLIAVSSATFRGFAQLTSLTNTTLHGITPAAVGELYYCNNCVAASVVCVSTGTTIGAFAEIESKTTACN
jgi:hypothetical protein